MIAENGDVYAIGTSKLYRLDFANPSNPNCGVKDVALAGFESIFDKEEFPGGHYKIALELDKNYVMCKEQLEL